MDASLNLRRPWLHRPVPMLDLESLVLPGLDPAEQQLPPQHLNLRLQRHLLAGPLRTPPSWGKELVCCGLCGHLPYSTSESLPESSSQTTAPWEKCPSDHRTRLSPSYVPCKCSHPTQSHAQTSWRTTNDFHLRISICAWVDRC